MTPAALAEAISNQAAALGFAKVAFCSAALPPQAAIYERWLAAGMEGTMDWMRTTRDRRLQPERLLPGVRSIVVVAAPYAQPGAPRSALPAGAARLARYAAGPDYHEAIGRRLAELAAFIEVRVPGARALPCVDAAPVLERLWAAQAGLGWIGRNALVLDEALGSWFFLGVILTTADLPAGEPAADQCGACTLCVESCPTEAIMPDRTVDSRRCLSYHTIELRGPIPEPARAPLEDRVFGCDDCQEVCPVNKPQSVPAPAAAPALIDLLLMTHAVYLELFGRSAVRRATWRGMRRNAAVALGNGLRRDGEAALPAEAAALRRVAADRRGDPLVRDAARWALSQIRKS